MAANFPASPTEGQIFELADGTQYRFGDGVWMQVAKSAGSDAPADGNFYLRMDAAWKAGFPKKATAQPLNWLLNPVWLVSQAITIGSSTQPSPATLMWMGDMWNFDVQFPQGVLRAINTTSSHSANKNALRVTCETASSAGSANYAQLQQAIEGYKAQNLFGGTPTAKPLLIQFTAYGTAGTYCLNIRGPSFKPCYVTNFTIPEKIPTVVSLRIPPPTIGTWTSYTNLAMFRVGFCFAIGAGSPYLATPNVWLDAQSIGTANLTNLCAAVGNTIEITDLQLYLDPNDTREYPGYAPPKLYRMQEECWRYYYRGVIPLKGVSTGVTTTNRMGMLHPAGGFRAAPAVSVSPGENNVHQTYLQNLTVSSIAGGANFSTSSVVEFDPTYGAAWSGAGETVSFHVGANPLSWLQMDARLI